MGKNILTDKRVFIITVELLKVCHTNADKKADWDSGLNDDIFAEAMTAKHGFLVNSVNVAHIRKDHVGPLHASSLNTATGAVATQLKYLCKRIDHIEKELGINDDTEEVTPKGDQHGLIK